MAPDELDIFIDELNPEGVWANIGRVPDEDTAMASIKKLGTWTYFYSNQATMSKFREIK